MKNENEAPDNETPENEELVTGTLNQSIGFNHDYRRETSLHAAITSFNSSGPVGTDKIIKRAGEFYAFLISGDIAAQSE